MSTTEQVDFAFAWNPETDDFRIVKIYKDFECPALAYGGPPPTYVEDIAQDHRYCVSPEDLTDDDDKPLTAGYYRWKGEIVFSETYTSDGHECSEEWNPNSVVRIGDLDKDEFDD